MRTKVFWRNSWCGHLAIAFIVFGMLNAIGAQDVEVFDNGVEIPDGFSASNFDSFHADDIMLSNDTRISMFKFKGVFQNNSPGVLRMDIIANDGSFPVEGGQSLDQLELFEPNTTFVDTGIDSSEGLDIYEITSTREFNLFANTTYWISIYEFGFGGNFMWAYSDGGNSAVSDFGGPWQTNNPPRKFDFQFFGFDAPLNDDWFNTFNLSLPFNINATNVGSSTQQDEQNTTNSDSTVWWFFNAPDDGTVTIDTFGSDFDTTLTIYEGFSPGVGLADLNFVTASFDAPDSPGDGQQSKVEFSVTAGECYEIRVGGQADPFSKGGVLTPSSEGSITLNGTFVPETKNQIMTVNVADPSSVVFQTADANSDVSFMDTSCNGITLRGFFSGNTVGMDEAVDSGSIAVFDSADATTTGSLTSIFVHSGGPNTDDFTFFNGTTFDIYTFDDQRSLFGSAIHDLTPFSGLPATGDSGDIVIGEPDNNQVIGRWQVVSVLLGDVNLDGAVNLLDVSPFVSVVANGTYQAEADINQDGEVNLLDVEPFVAILSGA